MNIVSYNDSHLRYFFTFTAVLTLSGTCGRQQADERTSRALLGKASPLPLYLGVVSLRNRGHSFGTESMAWHWRKRAHLILEVTYKIGEQPELQAVFLCTLPSASENRGARCFDGSPFVSGFSMFLLS
jgi:hypothetical protein